MTYPKPAFAVRLDAALRVRPFISTDAIRYYLNGISVEPCDNGGAICAATDGHRLGVRHDPDGLCLHKAVVLLPKEIKAQPKLLPSAWLVGILTGENKGHISIVPAASTRDEDTPEHAIERVEDCTLRVGRAFIDGSYPDWRRVIPKPGANDTVRSFNSDYVRGFGQHMTLRGAGESEPHLIEMPGEPEFLGVLMPMRANTRGALPEWLTAKPEPKKKAA